MRLVRTAEDPRLRTAPRGKGHTDRVGEFTGILTVGNMGGAREAGVVVFELEDDASATAGPRPGRGHGSRRMSCARSRARCKTW